MNLTSTIVLIASLASITVMMVTLFTATVLYNDINRLYDDVMDDMDVFKVDFDPILLYFFTVFAGDAWRDMMIIRTSSQSSRERKTIKSIFVREKRQDAGECNCGLNFNAVNCPAGPPGAPGAPGLTGAPGDPGLPGLVGQSGSAIISQQASGAGCIRCPPGPPGLQGPVGAPGSQGPLGPAGLAGNPGRNGAPGIEGPPGDAGSNGADGLIGVSGAPGNAGSRFINGPAGLKGQPGMPGPPGKPGQNGANGVQGPSGPAGLQGLPGQPGNPGIDGIPGQPGGIGLPGNDASYCPCPARVQYVDKPPIDNVIIAAVEGSGEGVNNQQNFH